MRCGIHSVAWRGAGSAIAIIAAVDLGDRMALSAHPGIIWGILALVGLTNATCYRYEMEKGSHCPRVRHLIGTPLIRALVLSAAALAGALTPVRCLGEDGNQLPAQLPAKATKELPPELLSLLRQKSMPKHSPILVRFSRKRRNSKPGRRTPPAISRSSRPIRSVGGRAILARSSMRATGRLRRGSIRLRPS